MKDNFLISLWKHLWILNGERQSCLVLNVTFLSVIVVLQCKHRPAIQEPLSFFIQSGVKNELFNSKQAFSWPFVCFDLGIRSLYECLYCHVMFPVCVWIIENSAGPRFIWWSLHCRRTGQACWSCKSPDVVYLSCEVTWLDSLRLALPKCSASIELWGQLWPTAAPRQNPPLPCQLSRTPECLGVACRQVLQVSQIMLLIGLCCAFIWTHRALIEAYKMLYQPEKMPFLMTI